MHRLGPAPGLQVCLVFGEIGGAAGGRAQHLGSKPVRAWFTIQLRKQSGSVESVF
jgi:hypothetical protein